MKYSILFLLACLSTHTLAGDLYYSKSFTSSQKSQVKKCYELDNSFPQQVNEFTSSGDILINGMIHQREGYMFLTKTNAYGSWMDFKPLRCDTRTTQEKAQADKIKHQKALEAARRKAKEDIEAAKSAQLAAKRAAEKKLIEDQAAAELRLINAQQAEAELKKQEQLNKNNATLKKQYARTAKKCISNDQGRVKKALFSALHSIHRPAVINIEDQKVSGMRFFNNIMEVSYSFKLYTQTQFGNRLGSKSEPNSLKDTKDINVKAYGRSTAVATCKL